MSVSSNDKRKAAIQQIEGINHIDGFDPDALTVEYTDLNTGEKRLRLPVMAQLAWFWLKYPDGKTWVDATVQKGYCIGYAKIYRNYMDPPECCLAQATAARKYDPEKPTVSPREWAQTAALGIALRNAGFGLQFHAAGDEIDQLAVNEFEELTPTPIEDTNAQDAEVAPPPPTVEFPAKEEPDKPNEPKDELAEALKLPCPIKRYAGMSLGDLVRAEEYDTIMWIAQKYQKDPKINAAAKLICERSLDCSA